MKRFLAVLVLVCMCISFAGCNLTEYKKARDLYDAGEFAQALEIYRTLGDYADSAKMAEICWQKADYKAAEACFAAGDYQQALALYTGLAMYMDSPMKAIACQYALGLGCLEAEDYAGAISWLEPLGNYEESLDKTHLARWLWLSEARCTRVFSDTQTDFRAISIEPEAEGALRILLENDSLLLGLPYQVRFTLTLKRNEPYAVYTVTYRSISSSTIEETASGVIDLSTFKAGAVLPVESFTQTVTDPNGEQTVSTEGADAIMIKGIMADAVNQIAENLPALLEKTGVDITVSDLGFAE